MERQSNGTVVERRVADREQLEWVAGSSRRPTLAGSECTPHRVLEFFNR